MSALELSSDVGLVALFVLTANLLMGLLLGIKYNPWRHWPHRRINYFRLHNWTGYVALCLCLLHVVLLYASKDANFRLVDVLWPVNAPKQPSINTVGALALYVLVVVVGTSYFRVQLGRRRWKVLHFGAYIAAVLFYVHGIWSDPTLKDNPIDYLDAEKFWAELCAVLVVVATVLRWRHARRLSREHAAAVRRAA